MNDSVRRGPRAADELPRLLEVLGIDAAALARSEPAALRDMERVCISCERKAQCNNDLEIGVSARNYEDYCLNASTVNALKSIPNGKTQTPRDQTVWLTRYPLTR